MCVKGVHVSVCVKGVHVCMCSIVGLFSRG